MKPSIVDQLYTSQDVNEMTPAHSNIHLLVSLQLLVSMSVQCVHRFWRTRFWRHDITLPHFRECNVEAGAGKPGNEELSRVSRYIESNVVKRLTMIPETTARVAKTASIR